MKQTLLCALFFITLSQGFAQKYITKTGMLDFEGSVEAFEPVKATHSTTTAILETSTGKIAVLGLVKGFRFRNALMEEHFNENYMESDTYPKATFNGSIEDFSITDSALKKEYKMQGDITIHGKTKRIDALVTIIKNGDDIDLETDFIVAPEDFDIEIPNLVKEKISENIRIAVRFHLVKRS